MIDNTSVQEFEFAVVAINEKGELTRPSTHRAHLFVEDLGKGVSLELVLIPEGSFLMGSRVGQGGADERPQHRVAVSPFLIGKYPVTQEQWQAIIETNSSRFKGARRPVDNVSWKDAAKFCDRLSKRTGRIYRLPGEAQWEYAGRARTTTPFYFGETLTTEVANFNGEFTFQAAPKGIYRHETTEVGRFPPNAFGLFDMHGNIWEWCADPWHDDYRGAPTDERVWEFGGDAAYRVVRGGCWHDTPDVCRSASRLKLNANEGDEFVGFRVVSLRR